MAIWMGTPGVKGIVGLFRCTEDMLAMQALQVVQNTGIQDFTQLGACYTDGGSAYETADQGSGNTA